MWGGLFLHWLISYLRFLLLAEIMTWLFNEITIDKLWVPSFFVIGFFTVYPLAKTLDQGWSFSSQIFEKQEW